MSKHDLPSDGASFSYSARDSYNELLVFTIPHDGYYCVGGKPSAFYKAGTIVSTPYIDSNPGDANMIYELGPKLD